MNNHFIIFDNKGETLDRYTILDKRTGDYYGASENPFHPQGFGQYSGNTADDRYYHEIGAYWRRQGRVKPLVKHAVGLFISEAKANPKWVGVEVAIESLPEDVQKYIKQLE